LAGRRDCSWYAIVILNAERWAFENMLDMAERIGQIQTGSDIVVVILVGFSVAISFAARTRQLLAGATSLSAAFGFPELQRPRASWNAQIVTYVYSYRSY
jgi:hypothetical protein